MIRKGDVIIVGTALAAVDLSTLESLIRSGEVNEVIVADNEPFAARELIEKLGLRHLSADQAFEKLAEAMKAAVPRAEELNTALLDLSNRPSREELIQQKPWLRRRTEKW